MMRNLGGAFGIAGAAAILNDQTNAHFVTIAGRLTPANGAMSRFVDATAHRYAVQPGGSTIGHEAALKHLWHLAYREASTLAYADAFRAIMLAFAVAAILVLFMRKVAAPPAPASAAH
jgi:DHA2 family multidrug resistance protein